MSLRKEGHVSTSKLLSSEGSTLVTKLNKMLKNPLQDEKNPLWNMNKVDQLISLLKNPNIENWERYAFSIVFSWRQNYPQITEEYGLEKIKVIATSDIKPSIEIAENAPKGNYLYIPKNKISENENAKGFFLLSPQFLQEFMQAMKGSNNTVNPKGVEGILRIEDDYTNRNTEDFKRLWNEFWRLSNLLQFLPNVYQVSRELVEEYGDDLNMEGLTDSVVPSDEWKETFEIIDESCKHILSEVMEGHGPIPEVGYEVATNQGTVGELELAWETKKVGVLLDDDQEVLNILKEQQWKVFFPTDIVENDTSLLSYLI